MRTRTEVSAGGVLVDAEGRVVLTARRTFGSELRWGLPKGHIEHDESPEEAAIREVAEETGMKAEVIAPLPAIDYWFVPPTAGERVRVHKTVHFFLMRATGGDPSSHDSETEEVGFYEGGEAIEAAHYASEKEIIAEALKVVNEDR